MSKVVGPMMTSARAGDAGAGAVPVARWGAVFALTLCVSTLIAFEFMPVSLLTPIASDLRISEGRAGQAIAVSGLPVFGGCEAGQAAKPDAAAVPDEVGTGSRPVAMPTTKGRG